MNILIMAFVGIAGSMVGSFLNVCIYRMPREESIVMPRSKCPQCNQLIPWYHNIPLLSYVFLLGKCRFCKAKIPFRYFFVEALSVFFAIEIYRKFGLSVHSAIYFSFLCSLIVVAFIDISHRIIPNEISFSGIALGLVYSFFNPHVTFLESLLGILLGGGVLFGIAEIYRLIRKIEGMGMGDVKLLAMIGAFLGWQSLFFVVLVSSFSGTLIGLALIAKNKMNSKYLIPFGTFLAGAAALYILYGNFIIQKYNDFLLNKVS